MTSPLPAALAIPLLALAGVAHSGPDQIPVHGAAMSAPSAVARATMAQPAPKMQVHALNPLDLRAPNFLSPRWQERLQGPTIDHSLDYMPMEFVIVTPGQEGKSNTRVASVGIGSVYWAATHPAQAWRVLMPVQEGDEFDTDREVALAYNDVQSDCPGFPGTPNVRPICP